MATQRFYRRLVKEQISFLDKRNKKTHASIPKNKYGHICNTVKIPQRHNDKSFLRNLQVQEELLHWNKYIGLVGTKK